MLRCVYINLDSATARRDAIEASFRRHAKPDFELVRARAFDANDVAARHVPGKSRPSEKGCFLSHRQVLLDHPDASALPLMVLEDDVEFGPAFFNAIGQFLAPQAFTWDVLFTDICVTSPAHMARLARLRPELAERKQLSVMDLKDTGFAGAAAYIVNPRSLAKVRGLLASDSIEAPYDMVLRRLVHTGAITAGCVFPFLTTLSRHSEDSANQLIDSIATDLIWNTFRKLMWVDRDVDACKPLLASIRDQCCDTESLLLAPILCAQASRKFKVK